MKYIKINYLTYILILICYLCGFIKNILIIIFICIVHELGHVFILKLLKYKVLYIEIFPFGGYTHIINKINSNINKDLMVAFGGILFQIILFVFIYIFQNNISINDYKLVCFYNTIIILFNLLPIVPLDGSKIVNLILEKYFSYKLSYQITIYISFIFLIVFVFINIYYSLDNYLIIFFLLSEIIIFYKNKNYNINRFLVERYLYNFDYNKIINNTKSIYDLKKNSKHYFFRNNCYINEKDAIKTWLKSGQIL